MVIFANKVDLVDENNINHANVQEMVENENFLAYFLTSAKTGKGVIEAFNAIIDELYRKYKELSMSIN